MDPYLNIFDEPAHRRMRGNAGNSTTIAVGVVALVIVLIAWWAFSNRTVNDDLSPGDVDPDTVLGDDVDDAINNATSTTNRAATDAEIAAARLKARTDLVAIQSRLEADQNYDEAIAAVDKLEADLERTYANTSGEVKAEWEETKAEFDRFEQGLRNGSADVMNVLAGLILMLEGEVRTDEEE